MSSTVGTMPWGCSGISSAIQTRVNDVSDLGVCLCWKVGSEVSEMAKSLQEARGSLMSDIETLNDLLNSLGET